MCGRFSFFSNEILIEEHFGINIEEESYQPSYNCAPSQKLAVISSENLHVLSFYRWGLIPFWAKDASIGNRLINARAETVDEKASFRNAFKKRPCLVLSNGFYEWKKEPGGKQAFFIGLKDGGLFAMAGLWELWKDAEGRPLRSFTIITTSPNELMSSIHNRMPVILPRELEKKWLANINNKERKEMLVSYPSELMKSHAVSSAVNSPLNNGPDLIKPLS